MRTCGKAKKGTPVIFVKKLTINEGDEDERKIFMHRSFTVFNVAQIEELPKEEVPETVIPDDAAHNFIAATLADIREGGDRACYIPSKDYINLPPVSAFENIESYYATAFHELGHNAYIWIIPRRTGVVVGNAVGPTRPHNQSKSMKASRRQRPSAARQGAPGMLRPWRSAR